jgi:hypothetical protein
MHITGFPMFALFLGPEDQSGPERSGSKIHRTGPRSQDLGPDPPRIRIRSGPDPDYSGSSRGLELFNPGPIIKSLCGYSHTPELQI